jgi:glucose-1-phosphate adenylyltransferase
VNSIASPGAVISGAYVEHSVLSPEGRGALLGAGRRVGADGRRAGRRYAVVRNAIVDKGVLIPENCRIGIDHEHDRARGFTVSDSGVVVIGKGQKVPA